MSWNRQTTFFVLFGLFLFSFFLYLPVYEDAKLKLLSLNTTLVLGTIWAWLGSTALSLPQLRGNWKWFLGLFFAALLIHLLPLTQGMPWRGDEDSNVDFVVIFSNLIPFQWFFLKSLLLILTAYFLQKYLRIGPQLRLVLAVVVVLLIAIFAFQLNTVNYYLPFQYNLIISRLPYLIRMLPVFPVLIGKAVGLQYTEWLYRIVPFLSAVAIVWIVTKHYAKDNRSLFILSSAFILSIPSLLFYASVLYLELTGVLLCSLVLLQVDVFLADDLVQLKKETCWLPLLLLGFVKETFLFLVLILLAARLMNRVFLLRKISIRYVLDEIVLALLLLLPLVYYLFIRDYNGNVRPGALSFEQLKQMGIYTILLKSFWQQFGLLSVLFLPAIGLYLVEKKIARALLFLAAVIGISLVFAADSGGVYTGYSRFNLLVFPFFLIAGMDLLLFVWKKRYQVALFLFLMGLGINVVFNPLQLDGSKKAYWGDYGYDTAEHYYPFRQALQKAKEKGFSSVTLLTNDYQPYFLRFAFQFAHLEYYPQWNIQTNPALFDQGQAIAQLSNTLNSGVQAVILQLHDYNLERKNVLSEETYAALISALSGFKAELVSNGAHQLLLVYR